jgi:hypothetical protein
MRQRLAVGFLLLGRVDKLLLVLSMKEFQGRTLERNQVFESAYNDRGGLKDYDLRNYELLLA